MTERAADVYRPENDPEVMKYWMRQDPRTAAFLLVIPGCAIIGCGVGLLFHISCRQPSLALEQAFSLGDSLLLSADDLRG